GTGPSSRPNSPAPRMTLSCLTKDCLMCVFTFAPSDRMIIPGFLYRSRHAMIRLHETPVLTQTSLIAVALVPMLAVSPEEHPEVLAVPVLSGFRGSFLEPRWSATWDGMPGSIAINVFVILLLPTVVVPSDA